MTDRALHAALRPFAEDAALALAAEVAGGAEVPYELAAEGGGRSRTPLYCYRPLTGAFVRERLGRLAGLASYAPAARALEGRDGLDAYLRAHGEARVPRAARDRADAALRVLLDELFSDSTDFALEPERVERALGALVAHTSAAADDTVTLVVGLPGLLLASAAVPLAEGIVLCRPDAVEDPPPDAAWFAADAEEPNALAVLTLHDAREAEAAPVRLRRLVRALRLYDAGAVGLAPAGWARRGDDEWQLVALRGSPARPGPPLAVAAEQEDELRAFLSLTARRMPRGGELAWALGRFDVACEREDPGDALTDLLLALRALLDPHVPSRLAALCAPAAERPALVARVEEAVALERAVVAGLAPPEAGVAALCEELAEHLRAVLGDALCGHLDADLRGAADLLLRDAGVAAP